MAKKDKKGREVKKETESEEGAKITLSSEDIPEVANWEEGGMYSVRLRLKQVTGTRGEGEESNADYKIEEAVVQEENVPNKDNNENSGNDSVEDIYG